MVIFGPLPLGEKGSYVNMSVGKKSCFWDNAKNHPQNRVFWILKKKIVHSCVDFLGLNHVP